MLETATLVGLLLALAGPPLIALLGSRPASGPPSLPGLLLGQALLAGLAAAVVAIVLLWEGQPLRSIGLKPPGWSTVAWGVGMAAFFILLLGPLLLRLPGWLGLGGFAPTLARLASLPLWYLLLAVLVGGVAEEVLYRGYALDRLGILLGSPWLAGLVVVLLFGFAHVPLWGIGPALTMTISGAALTLFFLWHGDLLANIIAHVTTDFAGIVLHPLLQALKRRTET